MTPARMSVAKDARGRSNTAIARATPLGTSPAHLPRYRRRRDGKQVPSGDVGSRAQLLGNTVRDQLGWTAMSPVTKRRCDSREPQPSPSHGSDRFGA
jgi:hypothetical protein